MIDQYLIGNHRNFTYLITFDEESLVVDPQGDLAPWEARMSDLGSRLTGVLLTHTHWDHIEGVPAIVKKYGHVPIYLHALDARRMASSLDTVKECFAFVDEGTRIPIGSRHVEALHTPGHSSGECCFLVKDAEPWKLFTGDTVFVGDVGRTDLESGSTVDLFHTLQRLKQLPKNTIIYPGHHYGRTPTSTIGDEKVNSAAFRCNSIEELDALP